MNYEGLRIKCPLCKRSDFNETTEKFDPAALPSGAMVRLQEKWRKKGLKRFFSDNCLTYQIACGFCGGALVKNKRLTLSDPLPVAHEPVEIEAVPAPIVEMIPVDIPVDKNVPLAQIEDQDGVAVVTVPAPAAGGVTQEMLAQYREFKAENPDSSWRDAWNCIPNSFFDHRAFATAMRTALAEVGK